MISEIVITLLYEGGNIMSVLPRLTSEKEILYHRKQFQETLNVHGILVKYYPVDRIETDNVLDIYNDIRSSDVAYKDPLSIRIVFETYPSLKTLKALGWFVKDEDLPYIAYIPVEYFNEDDSTISIAPNVDDKFTLIDNTIGYTGSRSTRDYIIKDIKSQGYPNTIYCAAKLVPCYETTDLSTEDISK